MRIISFSKKDWMNNITGKPKLEEPEFTTFRFPRKDKDWYEGEMVQVYFKSRTPLREKLGVAEITDKMQKPVKYISENEAKEDGFNNALEMWVFLDKPNMYKVINKLTLRWISH